MAEDGLAAFPGLANLDSDSARAFRQAARPMSVPAGTVMFRDGAECSNYVLVVNGSIRVHKLSEGGREIVLYRVERGQSCVLTTNCLIANENYGAEGIAETPVDLIILPSSTFKSLLAKSETFRDFVFSAFAVRISDLLMLIEEVAFGRIDARLAGWLSSRAEADTAIKATHQEIAVELGTAREVVSRQLKDFERRGLVELSRGSLKVLNHAALVGVAGPL
ncbi:Crp/Fnr family transcriptional regulator [Paramagnetospirillum kuznetsovii]|uniref:Crp/Fnr family transcriptional regulator n=1 Tax=Paramagnetospirillum kuznetsovii TaxID=2053833 RepID=A0A364NZP1_9PROT|nr:Crp/Fnr family transcriptional regulator [Paramagnetospirillum kuznetsovii]RAU22552.1 Crp/Fnr family transcriptional regulator [Paramagnetospirillum kuznetsovii]